MVQWLYPFTMRPHLKHKGFLVIALIIGLWVIQCSVVVLLIYRKAWQCFSNWLINILFHYWMMFVCTFWHCLFCLSSLPFSLCLQNSGETVIFLQVSTPSSSKPMIQCWNLLIFNMSQGRTTAGVLLFKIEAIRHNSYLWIHRNKAKKNKALRMIILFYVKKKTKVNRERQ